MLRNLSVFKWKYNKEIFSSRIIDKRFSGGFSVRMKLSMEIFLGRSYFKWEDLYFEAFSMGGGMFP